MTDNASLVFEKYLVFIEINVHLQKNGYMIVKFLVCFLATLIFCGCGVEQDENVYKGRCL